jgi:hypothetical protein
MTNERIYVVRNAIDEQKVPSIYTADAAMAQEEFLQLANINVDYVYIEDANTGEVYAYFELARDGWGTTVSRGVSREFTEILAGLRA